jgi:uncharacterized heparinase superfamily protein
MELASWRNSMEFEVLIDFAPKKSSRVAFVVARQLDGAFAIGLPGEKYTHDECARKFVNELRAIFICAGHAARNSDGVYTELLFDAVSCEKGFGRSEPIPLPQNWKEWKKEFLNHLNTHVNPFAC